MIITESMEGDVTLSCVTAFGIESVLKKEIERLGYGIKPFDNGMVSFVAKGVDVARTNINLRTADRVYIKLCEYNAESFDELFDGAVSFPWENFIVKNGKVIVNGKCVKSKLFSISDSQKILKKAIVKRLCEKYKINRLEESGSTYEVNFTVYKDKATLLLNTSGSGLHKRGYRDYVGIAPIKETLAAGLLLMSDFYYKRPLLDPFCGSGTFLIEGAMIAKEIAPNLRRNFAFNDWKNFDKKLYEYAVSEAKDRERRDISLDITGSDVDKKAIELSNRHIERAGLKDYIKLRRLDVKDLTLEGVGTIVTNPPYGERVYDKEEAINCYKNLGKAVKGSGWSLFTITAEKGFERAFGKKADRKRKIFNSNRECNFYYYYGEKERK